MNLPIGPRRDLQLLSRQGGAPGSAGFKLTGHGLGRSGMCRVWLRRQEPWERYLDPRFRSNVWDVRCATSTDGAFALVEEFTAATLDAIGEAYSFEADTAGIARLAPNGDPVHDTVLAWAKRVLGAPVDAPAEVALPAAQPAASRAEVPLREPAQPEAPASSGPATGTMALGALPVNAKPAVDAWDELAEVARRAATGSRNTVE